MSLSAVSEVTISRVLCKMHPTLHPSQRTYFHSSLREEEEEKEDKKEEKEKERKRRRRRREYQRCM